MATNPYISKKVRSEQNLYEDIVIESLKFYGEDVYYIPREIVNKDTIFADDVPSRFSDAYKIEMYIENTEGFDGEGDLFTKFGIELRDQATFVVARRRWKQLIGNNLDEKGFRPREGDVIYLPLSNSMFEILKVETETPFYQLSQLPTFRMQCELFEYSDEDFDTGIDAVDVVEYEGAFQYKVTMNNADANIPTFTSELDDQGSLTSVNVVSGGLGFGTVPTITIDRPTPTAVNRKFGTTSLHAYLGHGDEDRYLRQGRNGTVELFFRTNSLPQSGYQALFVTGGDSDKNQMIFAVDADAKINYGFVDNDGVSLKQLPTNFTNNEWTHFLFSHDNNNVLAYVNGTKALDSVSDRPLNLISGRDFSVGAFAAREADGVDYSSFSGRIDEFRALVGTSDQILDSRIAHTIQTFTYDIESGDGSDYTFASGSTDRSGELQSLQDPSLDIIIGDTVVLNNNTGGHPLQIKDGSDNVLATESSSTISYTFNSGGTYYYQCTVAGHGSMIGQIVVSAQPTSITVPSSAFDSNSNTAILRHFEGEEATLDVTVSNGSISAVTVSDGGLHYTTAPTLSVDNTTAGGNYLIGETVTQTNADYSIKGEVTRWSDSDRILQLAHVGSTDGTFRTISSGAPVIGASSDAEWIPKLVEDLQEIQNTAQNKVFDDFEGDFLDFSESNPFGDIF
jgi:plastocyanin